jgi:transitional endoplasmic reticulum ATPase
MHSWEVTQTNELLQQLETASCLVACTTNLFHDLDQAALRRFTFKIPFLFMRPEQAQALFRQTLAELGGKGDADPRELGRFLDLAPGDLAAVARRLRSLGETPTAAKLLAELKAEVGVKARTATRVGF